MIIIDQAVKTMYYPSMPTRQEQSRGGKARAASLSPYQRTDIARRAADARWAKKGEDSLLPRETHPGMLRILNREIPCSVLDNGMRVFSMRGINRAMGAKTTGKAKQGLDLGASTLPSFLASANLKPFIDNDLLVRVISPAQYRPFHRGRTAFGYEATLLPKICEVILEARKAKALKSSQQQLAEVAELLIRAFAHVGVIALIDEATGFQEDRAKDELERILAAFISPALLPWTQKFPHTFFRHVYRLHGWEYKQGTVKHPQYLGKFINKYVYGQFPPGSLERLQAQNPVMESGHRRHKNHQFLTVDTGDPHLDRVIIADITLMQISDSKEQFDDYFARSVARASVDSRDSEMRPPLVIDMKHPGRLSRL